MSRNLGYLAAGCLALSAIPGLRAAVMISQAPEAELESRMVAQLHDYDRADMRLGQLALKRASNRKVRRFGDRVTRDQRFLDRKLMAIARTREIVATPIVPRTPMEQDELKARAESIRRLQGIRGAQFDSEFLKAMDQMQRSEIQSLSAGLEHLPEKSGLRALVTRALPILGQQQELAEALEKEVSP